MSENTHSGSDQEVAAEIRYSALCNEQGWNESSQIIHLEGFLRDNGLFAQFVAVAEAAAAEENADTVLDSYDLS